MWYSYCFHGFDQREVPPRMFFYFLKVEYRLELIKNCMRLLVGGENFCSSCLKRAFHTRLPHQPLVVWYDMYENHICISIFLIYFRLAIMLQRLKIRIEIGVFLDM